jgi:hypothetical protein
MGEKAMDKKRLAALAMDKALASLSNKEKLELLEQKRYEVSQQLNINESKMTNGTQGLRIPQAEADRDRSRARREGAPSLRTDCSRRALLGAALARLYALQATLVRG